MATKTKDGLSAQWMIGKTIEKAREDGRLVIRLGGHYLGSEKWVREQLDSLFVHRESDETSQRFIEGDPKAKIKIGSCIGLRCATCGDEEIYATNGRKTKKHMPPMMAPVTLSFASKCAYPEAHTKPYSAEIVCKSGKLLFANDLRALFPMYKDWYVNELGEIIRCTHDFATQGMIHVCVGNTCPSVNQVNERSLVVGKPGPNVSWDKKAKKYTPLNDGAIKKEALPGTEAGSICTDLWWFSAADLDAVKARAKSLNGTKAPGNNRGKINVNVDNEIKDKSMFVVDVKPGTYRVTVRYHIDRKADGEHDYDKKREFARINRVGPVPSGYKDPPIMERPMPSIEESIHAMALAYPDIYGSRRHCLDQMYCVCGSGYAWENGIVAHDHGTEYEKAMERVLRGARAKFDGKTIRSHMEEGPYSPSLYPFTSDKPSAQYYRVACVPNDAREDYVFGAFEVLSLALEFENNKPNSDNHRDNKENAKHARVILKSLVKRFPKQAKIASEVFPALVEKR